MWVEVVGVIMNDFSFGYRTSAYFSVIGPVALVSGINQNG